MKKIIKILFLILLNSITVFAQYQYPTAEQLHNFQGGGGIGMPITGSLGEQYSPISPKLRSTVDNFNLAMGVIGISHVGRGLYHFGANLADNTKLALANNESIRAIVTAKFLDWKVSITNLDNLNEAEKILIQEGRIAELRMVDGINSKLTDADFRSLEKQWVGWRLMGVTNGVGNNFFKTLDEFAVTFDKAGNVSQSIRQQAFDLYNAKDWGALENLFISNNIKNGGVIWAPANGGFNIVDNVPIKSGQKFDRYGDAFGNTPNGNPNLGGNFTSPIENNAPFNFGERALNKAENTYDFITKLKCYKTCHLLLKMQM